MDVPDNAEVRNSKDGRFCVLVDRDDVLGALHPDDVAVVLGSDASDAVAAQAGAHGATSVMATGDLDGGLQGVNVAAAIAAAIESGSGPDAVLAGTTYDGRDVAARLSVALDAPVITNVVDLEVDGDALVGTEPVFGGSTNVKTKFTGGKAQIVLVRPKSFAAEELSLIHI